MTSHGRRDRVWSIAYTIFVLARSVPEVVGDDKRTSNAYALINPNRCQRANANCNAPFSGSKIIGSAA